MTSFAHDLDEGVSTLSEMMRVYEDLSPDNFFGCYAYATQSGFRSFELAFGSKFWSSTSSRWLFGIDYGRTDPRAMREIALRKNTDVRVFDGAWIVDQDGFLPRRDFHAKVALMENAPAKTSGLVLGSGNFSYNGLERSVEAGASAIAKSTKEIVSHISPVKDVFEKLWLKSTPLSAILEKYESRREAAISGSDFKKLKKIPVSAKLFWIEAGYVTKNRGENHPGNQIFFPRGFSRFFGYKKNDSAEKNSIIGPVTFITDTGDNVTNNLRLNRNGMEKMSLPIPETHGFGVYDGKILVFEDVGGAFVMKALEAVDFEALFGDRTVGIERMNGGRRYGAII